MRLEGWEMSPIRREKAQEFDYREQLYAHGRNGVGRGGRAQWKLETMSIQAVLRVCM